MTKGHPRFSNLSDWLSWQEHLHPGEIELGLDRVGAVFRRLHPQPCAPVVISVAGTNGKGSSVAMLDAIYRAAGYRVGRYTSPHLFKYNERICIEGKPVSDESLCKAFTRIDQARGDISLTYFEFGTLAALDIFLQQSLDVMILEVGLGGRLDAVNIIDPDVALITALGLDHVQWLGNDIDSIAREKAGIMRGAKPVVSSSLKATDTLLSCAKEKQANLYQLEQDYFVKAAPDLASSWEWSSTGGGFRTSLPRPALFGDQQLGNAAGVLMVIELLAEKLPVGQSAVRDGLRNVRLAGRFQILPGKPQCIFDVAHNCDAMQQLAAQLQQLPCEGKTFGVLGMLSDKDSEAAIAVISKAIDAWFIAPLSTPRTASVEMLGQVVKRFSSQPVYDYLDTKQAFEAARQAAASQDRVVVFGSFYTVAEVMPQPV